MNRRDLLKRLGLAGVAVVAMPDLSRVLLFRQSLAAQTTASGLAGKLTASEAVALAALCARLIPTDDNGPGATEAHASSYIDRALGDALAGSHEAYTVGLADLDERARAKGGQSFAALPAPAQDALLSEVQDTPFFGLVRGHTLQGTFCDPAYGGNANFVGWDMLGYPGVRLIVSPDDQRMSSPPRPNHRSAYDYAMFSLTHPMKSGGTDAR